MVVVVLTCHPSNERLRHARSTFELDSNDRPFERLIVVERSLSHRSTNKKNCTRQNNKNKSR